MNFSIKIIFYIFPFSAFSANFTEKFEDLFKITEQKREIFQSINFNNLTREYWTGQLNANLMPNGSECGQHWEMCPNMCSLMDQLPKKFIE